MNYRYDRRQDGKKMEANENWQYQIVTSDIDNKITDRPRDIYIYIYIIGLFSMLLIAQACHLAHGSLVDFRSTYSIYDNVFLS